MSHTHPVTRATMDGEMEAAKKAYRVSCDACQWVSFWYETEERAKLSENNCSAHGAKSSYSVEVR